MCGDTTNVIPKTLICQQVYKTIKELFPFIQNSYIIAKETIDKHTNPATPLHSCVTSIHNFLMVRGSTRGTSRSPHPSVSGSREPSDSTMMRRRHISWGPKQWRIKNSWFTLTSWLSPEPSVTWLMTNLFYCISFPTWNRIVLTDAVASYTYTS